MDDESARRFVAGRAVIDQAKGLLMGSQGGALTAVDAHAELVAASLNTNLKVRRLAVALIQVATGKPAVFEPVVSADTDPIVPETVEPTMAELAMASALWARMNGRDDHRFRVESIDGLRGVVHAFFMDRPAVEGEYPSGVAVVHPDDRDDFTVHRLIFRSDGVVAENGRYNLTWDRAVEVFLGRSGLAATS
jgi:ANTAR domain